MNRSLLTLLTLVLLTLACVGPSLPTYTPVPVLLTPSPNAEVLTPRVKIPTPNATPNALGMVFVTADEALHVRNQPLGTVIGYLYHGEAVTLTNRCSDDPPGWAEIVWKDGTAWVNAKFLSDNRCKE